MNGRSFFMLNEGQSEPPSSFVATFSSITIDHTRVFGLVWKMFAWFARESNSPQIKQVQKFIFSIPKLNGSCRVSCRPKKLIDLASSLHLHFSIFGDGLSYWFESFLGHISNDYVILITGPSQEHPQSSSNGGHNICRVVEVHFGVNPCGYAIEPKRECPKRIVFLRCCWN